MKVLELHSIQNFPPNGMNRDENGSPKTAVMGGVLRARQSSQTKKKACRTFLKSTCDLFGGIRTMFINKLLLKELQEMLPRQDVSFLSKLAHSVTEGLSTMDKKDKEKSKTLLFFSFQEIKIMAEEIAAAINNNTLETIFKKKKKTKDDEEQDEPKTEAPKKRASKKGKTQAMPAQEESEYTCELKHLLKSRPALDNMDILLFGRCLVSEKDLSVEAASQYSHPISVHSVETDYDYFTAMSDVKEEQAAAFIGETEFNSACFYSYVGLNIDMFNKSTTEFSSKQKQLVIQSFIEANIIAVPEGRKNTMFAKTRDPVVLGLVRDNTFDMSLANAFEKPIYPKNGYSEEARKRLTEKWESAKKTYGKRLGIATELWFPDQDLDTFSKTLAEKCMSEK